MQRVFQYVVVTLVMLGLSALLLVAGWQFWPDGAVSQPVGPSAGRAGAALPDEPSFWLISATGGPVSKSDAQAYLMHDRSTADRVLSVRMTTSLESLLLEGEVMPDAAFLEVMADIRAPNLAERLCPVLSSGAVERCLVAAARVEKGSVDPIAGTATFNLTIRFSLATDPDDLPDLARFMLQTSTVQLPAGVTAYADAEDALQALLSAANDACKAEGAGQECRLLRLKLDVGPGHPAAGEAVIGSLYPLPETMRPAPELLSAPKS